jgi:transcriptional regulator with XRE-family HTH domain
MQSRISQQLFELRQAAGLTQAELAHRIGTVAPVISRWENERYAGHSLSTLRRIARALGHQLEVRFVPESER